MIIVGIPPCKACKVLAEQYPAVEYVELPLVAGKGNPRALEVKKAIRKLNITGFPVVINNEMTEVLTYSALEFADV